MAVFTGTAGTDTLTDTAAADELYGYDGNDSLSGVNGDDLLEGGFGADTLRLEEALREKVPTEAIQRVAAAGTIRTTPHVPEGTQQRLKTTTEMLARIQTEEQRVGFSLASSNTVASMKRAIADYKALLGIK